MQDDGLNILHTEAEDISIKVEWKQVSICPMCPRRHARPCCSLMETSVTFLTTIRDSWNLPASPSPHLPASATISEIYPDLICPPPPPAFCGCEGVLPVGAGPGRREGEAGAQADAAFGKAAGSGKPSCSGELLGFCLRHDAPPEPQSRAR